MPPETGTRPSAEAIKAKLIPHVKTVIPVASGKGGVGKSTVSANLALALAQRGAKVGLMDADVYGPSIPTILGVSEKPVARDGRLLPVERYGVKIISMGFFIALNQAVIWRGPMLHKMVNDFLGMVEWGTLDYLVVDLPPGTGDIQLSLCQTIPVTGAVIVSTPQDVAWNVAQKAIVMFDKLRAPVLGVIENMSHYTCPKCHHEEPLFGRGGAERAAKALEIPYLGAVPLVRAIRETADQGDPVVHSAPESPAAAAFRQIAERLEKETKKKLENPDDKIAPVDIATSEEGTVKVTWNDGKLSSFDAKALRLACPCAGCVDEITGQRKIEASWLKPDTRPVAVTQVGRYALQIVWNDGHNTGLYGFDYLRGLAAR